MIAKVEMLTNAQLEHIRQIVGEAFVTNELFHNWGTEEERRNDVLKYMGIYVDYVYRAGELFANENMTGFIGLEDSYHKPVWPQIRMIFKMLVKIRLSKVKSLLAFAKQISVSNERYAKQRHFEALMVCVDKNQQGKGIASELVRFAKEKADMEGIRSCLIRI